MIEFVGKAAMFAIAGLLIVSVFAAPLGVLIICATLDKEG